MIRLVKLVLPVVLTGALLLPGGCSDSTTPTSHSDDEVVTIQNVTPADGAEGVATNNPVTISFSGPVDTISIMRNFHLGGGEPMHQWRDSLNHLGGFGMMGINERERMMDWIDSIQLPGEFHWSERGDSCEFVPDSLFAHGTDYLCLLYEGGMRGRHGGIMGGPQHGDSGYHTFQFTTQGGNSPAPQLLGTTPGNGASSFDRDDPVELRFSEAMDTLSVREGFYFCGGEEMFEWMDSLDHHRGMGGMGMVDMGHMMQWLSEIDLPGEFGWNEGRDTCWFYPDSTMTPQQDYLIYLSGDIHDHHGAKMNMHHYQYDGPMIHFRTGS